MEERRSRRKPAEDGGPAEFFEPQEAETDEDWGGEEDSGWARYAPEDEQDGEAAYDSGDGEDGETAYDAEDEEDYEPEEPPKSRRKRRWRR